MRQVAGGRAGWWCEPTTDGGSDMVLLLLHGNAGNLSDRADLVSRLVRPGVAVFIIDYRGYGRSGGRPSERGLALDAAAAWRHLGEDLGVPADRVVLFGRSLGGAVAVELATRVDAAGLILESTFTSIADMARHHMPVVPTALIRTRMDSLAKVGMLRLPKLFIHSPSDEVVPYVLGRRLFAAAPEPKRFFEVAGAGHNETYLVGGSAYFAALRDFIAECGARGRSG